ncbi:hypothetical protein DQ04_13021020 [Trypanosoma grayi]|uniref:hypothetical protein n=1 Tax=Trypanosoma grayi TaxID=71804 RepID=UPI0004F43302|nr:hypothetical protein DQ04_13021020 [Trypanosoma grayi]KEG06624.1 hypothetical protein DQ04_13021020 [Trypanosoma grayi]
MGKCIWAYLPCQGRLCGTPWWRNPPIPTKTHEHGDLSTHGRERHQRHGVPRSGLRLGLSLGPWKAMSRFIRNMAKFPGELWRIALDSPVWETGCPTVKLIDR